MFVMGLLGGFRAKFSRNSVAKKNSQNSKNGTVVCIGYRVVSEFQEVPQYRSIQEPPVTKRPSPIKTVLPPSDPDINGINKKSLLQSPERPIGTMIITNPTAKKSLNKLVSNDIHSRLSNDSVTQSDHLNVSNNYITEISRFSEDISKKVQVTVKPRPAVRSISYDKNSKTKNYINTVFADDDFNTDVDEETTYIVKEPGKSIIKSTATYSFDNTENISASKNDDVLIVDVTDDYSDQDDDEPFEQTSSYANKRAERSSPTKLKGTFNLHTITHFYEIQNDEEDDNTESRRYQEAQSSQATSFQEEHTKSNKTIITKHVSSAHSFKTTSTLGGTSNASNKFFASDDEEEPRPAPRKLNMKINRERVESRSSAEC